MSDQPLSIAIRKAIESVQDHYPDLDLEQTAVTEHGAKLQLFDALQHAAASAVGHYEAEQARRKGQT